MTENTLLHGLTYQAYDALPGLRAGHLKKLKQSPAHFMASQETPPEDTEAFHFGRLFHSAMENQEKFLDTFVVEPVFIGKTKDGRDSALSGEAKQMKKDWYASLPPGTQVIPAKWADDLVGMLRSVTKHKILGQMMTGGMKESTLVVTDPATGEPLKCRPDLIAAKGYLIDFKSTRDASPDFFQRQIFSTSSTSPFYALQASHYSHCARLAGVGRGETFVFAAVEKTKPWGVMVYPLDRGGIEVGESHREPLTKLFAKCKAENLWPSYPERAHAVEIPQWASWPSYPEEDE